MRKEIRKVVRLGTQGYRLQFHDGSKQEILKSSANDQPPMPGDDYEVTSAGNRIIPRKP